MTNDKFNKILESQLDYCKQLLITKNIEYKGELDRLHTFKVAAEMQGCNNKQALAGMMAKHTASVYDMCKGGEYSIEKWEEKITDHINYLLLLKAIVIEEAENNEQN